MHLQQPFWLNRTVSSMFLSMTRWPQPRTWPWRYVFAWFSSGFWPSHGVTQMKSTACKGKLQSSKFRRQIGVKSYLLPTMQWVKGLARHLVEWMDWLFGSWHVKADRKYCDDLGWFNWFQMVFVVYCCFFMLLDGEGFCDLGWIRALWMDSLSVSSLDIIMLFWHVQHSVAFFWCHVFLGCIWSWKRAVKALMSQCHPTDLFSHLPLPWIFTASHSAWLRFTPLRRSPVLYPKLSMTWMKRSWPQILSSISPSTNIEQLHMTSRQHLDNRWSCQSCYFDFVRHGKAMNPLRHPKYESMHSWPVFMNLQIFGRTCFLDWTFLGKCHLYPFAVMGWFSIVYRVYRYQVKILCSTQTSGDLALEASSTEPCWLNLHLDYTACNMM